MRISGRSFCPTPCGGSREPVADWDSYSATGSPLPGVHPTAKVSPHASIHPTAVIGPGATGRPGVSVGEDASIGADAVVRANAFIGDRAVVGPGAKVTEGTWVGSDVRIGEDARVGLGVAEDRRDRERASPPGTSTPLSVVTIGSRASIGARAVIMYGSELGAGARVGNDARVLPGTRVRDGATVLDGGSTVPRRDVEKVPPQAKPSAAPCIRILRSCGSIPLRVVRIAKSGIGKTARRVRRPGRCRGTRSFRVPRRRRPGAGSPVPSWSGGLTGPSAAPRLPCGCRRGRFPRGRGSRPRRSLPTGCGWACRTGPSGGRGDRPSGRAAM